MKNYVKSYRVFESKGFTILEMLELGLLDWEDLPTLIPSKAERVLLVNAVLTNTPENDANIQKGLPEEWLDFVSKKIYSSLDEYDQTIYTLRQVKKWLKEDSRHYSGYLSNIERACISFDTDMVLKSNPFKYR